MTNKVSVSIILLLIISSTHAFRSCANALLQASKNVSHHTGQQMRHNFKGIESHYYPIDPILLSYIDEQTTFITTHIRCMLLKQLAYPSMNILDHTPMIEQIENLWKNFITESTNRSSYTPGTLKYIKNLLNTKIAELLHTPCIQDGFKNDPLTLGSLMIAISLGFKTNKEKLEYISSMEFIK